MKQKRKLTQCKEVDKFQRYLNQQWNPFMVVSFINGQGFQRKQLCNYSEIKIKDCLLFIVSKPQFDLMLNYVANMC